MQYINVNDITLLRYTVADLKLTFFLGEVFSPTVGFRQRLKYKIKMQILQITQ